MGARPSVIENAAEIGIEHNLGLTCDPIAGLVQAPCIERNALGAVKAVVAAQLALANPSGEHAVSLDDGKSISIDVAPLAWLMNGLSQLSRP
jgi:L-serine dehydratase